MSDYCNKKQTMGFIAIQNNYALRAFICIQTHSFAQKTHNGTEKTVLRH